MNYQLNTLRIFMECIYIIHIMNKNKNNFVDEIEKPRCASNHSKWTKGVTTDMNYVAIFV